MSGQNGVIKNLFGYTYMVFSSFFPFSLLLFSLASLVFCVSVSVSVCVSSFYSMRSINCFIARAAIFIFSQQQPYRKWREGTERRKSDANGLVCVSHTPILLRSTPLYFTPLPDCCNWPFLFSQTVIDTIFSVFFFLLLLLISLLLRALVKPSAPLICH